MIIYFAAPRKPDLPVLWGEGARHVLVSYADTQFGVIDDALRMGFRVMLDSGAYSAFSRGVEIDVADYAAVIREYRNHVDAYVNLDVCDDAAQTTENQAWLESQGLAPIPVYHFGEEWCVLDGLVARGYPYIGLGNSILSSQRPQGQFRRWVHDACIRYPSVQFHGFAVGGLHPEYMGLYSADSTTWLRARRYGELIGRHGVVQGRRYRLHFTPEEMTRHNIRALLWQKDNTPGVRAQEQRSLFGGEES